VPIWNNILIRLYLQTNDPKNTDHLHEDVAIMKLLNTTTAFLIALSLSPLAYTQVNNCLDLYGNENYVIFLDVNDLGSSDFTLEAWVYLDAISPDGSKIISKGLTPAGSPSNAGYALRASKNAPDEIEFEIGHSDGSTARVFYNGIATGQWYHVAGVRSGLNIYLYLDGVLVAQDVTSVVFNVNTNMPLSFGAFDRGPSNPPVSEYLDGRLDEVRMWSAAKTQTDIFDMKDCAITTAQTNLLSVHNMNESGSWVAYDSSTNGVHGGFPYYSSNITSTVALICVASTDENNVDDIVVYPNPTRDAVTVELSSEMLGLTYLITDNSGRRVDQGVAAEMSTHIDLSSFPSGTYLLIIESQSGPVRITKV
jgi:hypothetical protein